MSGRFDGDYPSEIAGLISRLDGLRDRLDTLEAPDGNQLYQTVEKLTGLISDIQAQLDNYIATGTYTKAQIDAKLASPGAIAPTSVTVAGGGTIYTDGPLRAPSVYSTILATDYRAVWVTGSTGQLGYVPSSRQFKQDIETAVVDDDLMVKLRLACFRYIAAVDELGDDAERVVGLIAEDVHDLGAHWLVDYDAAGAPFGVRYDRLVFVIMAWGQRAEERLSDIERRLAEAGL